MSLGIFVEGQSDLQAIPVLIRKLGYSSRVHCRKVGQGAMLQVDKMSRHISALKSTAGRLSQILVFMDSEGVDPDETLRVATPVCRRLGRLAGRVPVQYLVVDHSLEGWLACDIEALRAVLGRNARIRITGNPEDHPRPAKLLSRVFRDNGVNFVKTVHNPRLAEHATAANISEKSPTFRRLATVVRGG